MENYSIAGLKRLCSAFRAVLQSANQTLTPELKDLGQRYVTACNEVNARLQRCQEFLNAGLTAEAVHLCQTPPDLLEQAAILSFPERTVWGQLSTMYPLPPAPALNHATATALNQALAQQGPLEPLLGSLRRAALIRAPLTQRMAILRKIQATDPANPLWDEEIQRNQRDRQEELAREISAASKADDLGLLEALFTEITKTSWLTSLPGQLVQLAHQALLGSLVNQLTAAQRNRNVWQGQAVKDKLEHFFGEAILPPDTPLRGRAQRALDWLQDEERKERETQAFDSALKDLASALQQGQDGTTLRKLMREAKAFRRPIPADLTDATHTRLVSLDRQLRSQQRKWITVGFAAAFVVLVLVAWWMYGNVQNRRFEDAMDNIARELENDRLGAATAQIQEFEARHPGYATRSRMIELKNELASKLDQQKRRRADFETALRRLEAAPIKQVQPPELKQAEALAREPEEFAMLNRVKRDREERHLDQETARDRRFDSAVKDLAIRAKALRDDASKDANEKLAHLQTEADKLAPQLAEVSPALAAEFNNLRTDLEDIRAAQGLKKKEDDYFKRLSALVSGEKMEANAYATLLEEFVNELPKNPHTPNLRVVLKERPVWEGLLAWSTLKNSWRNEPLPDPLQEAQSRTKQCQRLLKAESGSIPDQVRNYCNSLSAKLEVSAKEIDGLMNDRLIADLLMIRAVVQADEGEVTLYASARDHKNVEAGKKEVIVRVLQDGNGGSRPRIIEVKAVRLSPQSQLARRWQDREHQSRRSIGKLEAALFDLAVGIQEDKDLDPILQVIMLRAVLKAAAEGSPFAAHAVEKARSVLDAAVLDLTVPWMNPKDRGANEVRLQASDLMKQVPSIAECVREAAALREKAAAEFAKDRLALGGFLWRAPDGWTVVLRPEASPGPLVTFRTAGNKLDAMPMGRVRDGHGVLDKPDPTLLTDGRLLFSVGQAAR